MSVCDWSSASSVTSE